MCAYILVVQAEAQYGHFQDVLDYVHVEPGASKHPH